MSKSMLDPIVRALIGVDPKHHGVVLDISNKLSGKNADEYRKRLAAVLREPIAPFSPLDSVVRVDRSTKPMYPEWVAKKDFLVYPAGEQMGPDEFDVNDLDRYLFGKQLTGGYETGHAVHQHLLDEDLIKSCLNVQQLLAIQAKGIEFFRAHFNGKAVFAWKSLVRSRHGDLNAPYLIEIGGQVKLDWSWLGNIWFGSGPALRFAS